MSSQKRLFLTTRFKIERTKNQRGSCKFLAIFTKTLIERYSGKDLRRVGLSDVGSDADDAMKCQQQFESMRIQG